MVQIQFSLIKKNKDWTSRTIANPHLPTSDNILFFSKCSKFNVDFKNAKKDQENVFSF